MVAEGDDVEAGLEPFKRVRGMRTAVDQVSDAEEPITGGIEEDLAKRPFQGPEASVYVTRNDVASAWRTIAGDNGNDGGLRVGRGGHRRLVESVEIKGTFMYTACMTDPESHAESVSNTREGRMRRCA